MIIIIIIILKAASQAQVGHVKLFINSFRNPTSTSATENWKNTTHGSNTRLIKPIQRSGV